MHDNLNCSVLQCMHLVTVWIGVKDCRLEAYVLACSTQELSSNVVVLYVIQVSSSY